MQLNYLIIAQNLWSPCNLLILLGVEFKFKIIWPPRNGRNQGGNGEWLIYSGVAQETRHVQVSINNRLLKEWRLSIISRCSLSRTLGITIKVTLCDFASFSKPLSWNRPCPTWRSHSTIIGLVLTSKVGGNGVMRVGVHQVWKIDRSSWLSGSYYFCSYCLISVSPAFFNESKNLNIICKRKGNKKNHVSKWLVTALCTPVSDL